MKSQKFFNQFNLRADVLEYLFVEWLVRNHLYRKYAKNLEASGRVTTSVRDTIRERARLFATYPLTDFSFFLASSFDFAETPEGREFWIDASNRWAGFCKYFFSSLS